MVELPTQALSLRQPWAYFILHLPPEHRKCVENRKWGPSSFRGPFWIHASKGMTKREFYEALEFAESAFVPGSLMPSFDKLERGGIVGHASLTGYFPPGEQRDRWHMREQYGYLVADATPVKFVPCAGKLGFFPVEAALLEQLRRSA
jgi:hypothetical protein